MAFREVRIYFEMPDKYLVIELQRGLAKPFTFYMDAVMRGRFKAYSGPEVKGINIVNLCLCELMTFQRHKMSSSETSWHPMMNTYQQKSVFDFQRLQGTREERVGILIDVFAQEAEKSLLPQMQMLVRHIKESKGKSSINDSIQRADEYLKALHERVQQRAQ